jgi:enolase-phosphatase E1
VIEAVVLDIEGTTSSTEFVTSTLFPYSRQRFGAYIAEHRGTPAVERVLEDVRAEANAPDATDERLVELLEAWVDADAKVTPLKTLQGWIWREGFERGDLTAHLFDDVVPALRAWHARGIELAIFSSGSVDAQRAWFSHSPAGDLTPMISAYFDTENAGAKRDADSYRKIATTIGRAAPTIAFLSDVRAELDAARAAGWCTIGVDRPGEPGAAHGFGDHQHVASFAAINLATLG